MRDTLILLSSQLSTGRIWQPIIPWLPADLAIHALAPPDRDSIPAMAIALLQRAPDRFSLAAHGMGGFIAFEMVRQAPARIARLALLGTLADADGPDQRTRRAEYSARVASGDFAGVIDSRVPLVLHPERTLDPVCSEAVTQMARSIGPDRFLRQQQAIIDRVDSHATLADIVCPTLILGASHDRVAPPAAIHALANGIPNARLVELSGCGHFMQLEDPAAVGAALRHWLLQPVPRTPVPRTPVPRTPVPRTPVPRTPVPRT